MYYYSLENAYRQQLIFMLHHLYWYKYCTPDSSGCSYFVLHGSMISYTVSLKYSDFTSRAFLSGTRSMIDCMVCVTRSAVRLYCEYAPSCSIRIWCDGAQNSAHLPVTNSWLIVHTTSLNAASAECFSQPGSNKSRQPAITRQHPLERYLIPYLLAAESWRIQRTRI